MKAYSVTEIADFLGTNPETVRRWIRKGKLQAVANSKKKGENKVILEGAFNAFLQKTPKYAALAASITLGMGAATLGMLGVSAARAVQKAKAHKIEKVRIGADSVYTFLTTKINEERAELEALLDNRAELDQKIQIKTDRLNQLLDNLNEMSDTTVNKFPKFKGEKKQ